MNSQISPSALFFLGRRIERLLYVGVVLLVLCFVELYFVSVSVSFASEGESSVGMLLTQLEENKSKLASLFQNLQSSRTKKLLAEREQRVAETRKRLGLPPMLVSDQKENKETYAGALTTIVQEVGERSRANPEVIGKSLDVSKSPEENIKVLRELLKSLEKKSATIWGIETPRFFSIQYGGSDYHVPANFLATSLVFVLVPLLVGWFGSFYLTRQQELIAIARLEDHKLAFPHILNLMPVDFTQFEKRFGATRQINNKWNYFGRAANRYFMTLLRSILILAFAVPMVFVVLYSARQLISQVGGEHDFYLILGGFLFLILTLQALLLVVQEWVFMHKIQFYE